MHRYAWKVGGMGDWWEGLLWVFESLFGNGRRLHLPHKHEELSGSLSERAYEKLCSIESVDSLSVTVEFIEDVRT